MGACEHSCVGKLFDLNQHCEGPSALWAHFSGVRGLLGIKIWFKGLDLGLG